MLLEICCLGCAKPDQIVRIDSSAPGMYFTIETYHGQGAISSDFTKIYVHLENGNKSDRELVLDGEYLEDTKVTWLNPNEVTLCMPDGITDTFRNRVRLSAGADSQTIRSHLREHCSNNLVIVPGQNNHESGDNSNPPRLEGK